MLFAIACCFDEVDSPIRLPNILSDLRLSEDVVGDDLERSAGRFFKCGLFCLKQRFILDNSLVRAIARADSQRDDEFPSLEPSRARAAEVVLAPPELADRSCRMTLTDAVRLQSLAAVLRAAARDPLPSLIDRASSLAITVTASVLDVKYGELCDVPLEVFSVVEFVVEDMIMLEFNVESV